VQFTAGALLAVAFRVNLPISMLVTLYSNPFTIVPLYLTAWGLGQLVLFHGESLPSPPPGFAERGFGEWLQALLGWLASVGKPLAVGLPLLAILLAVVGYIVVDHAWRLYVRCAWRRRADARRARAP
jgi:hypothetical protein